MKKIILSLAVLAAILLPALYGVPAHAQPFTSTWVSRSGHDSTTCGEFFSPCMTLNVAVANTADGGAVSCLDSGDVMAFSVTISVSIDCSGTVARTFTCVGNTAVTINAPGKVVSLRGLAITGVVPSECIPGSGIVIQAAKEVHIEDCVIEDLAEKGIVDQRVTGLTELVIKNTVVRNNSSAGIVAGAAPRNSVVLENVQSVGNAYGIGVATGNNVVMSRSVMSENSVAGIEVDAGGTVIVENTKISHNATYGIFAQGTVTLANSDISFNATSINGSTLSYGNNRIFDNGAGNAPALISQQ